jgi:biopolymer transport protein TolR
MAGGMDLGTSSGSGKKKALDATINLVPFIDLMAVTISFLIMTAVWTQIGRLQVSSAGGDSDPNQDKDDKLPPIVLLLAEKEIKISVGSAQLGDAITNARDDKGQLQLAKVQDLLKKIREQIPDQTAITVQTEDDVHYEDLVRVIDECIGDGLTAVSVSPVAS